MKTLKRFEKANPTGFKIGQELYQVLVDMDGSCELTTHRITYIAKVKNAGEFYRVHAIAVNEFTWVKRSKKHYDWGWSKNIPSFFRDSFSVRCDDGKREVRYTSLATTKLKAWKDALKDVPRHVDDEGLQAKAYATIRRQITALSNKRKKIKS